jgi:hypothetical protein
MSSLELTHETDSIQTAKHNSDWSGSQKFWFRVAFIFFTVIAIPTSPKWYTFIYNLNWLNLHCRDLYNLTNYTPDFVELKNRYGFAGFASWGVLFIVSVIGSFIWGLVDAKRKNYDVLYYWLRVIVRYRAALGIIGFGFLKLFPAQMPYPSLGILNGDFGDMTQQKVYWMSVAIVPFYQAFSGVLEVSAGVLLLFRKTIPWGSALLFSALGTIAVVNVTYDNTLHVYATYFAVASAFLLLHDLKKSKELLIDEIAVVPYKYYYPPFAKAWQKYTRIFLKSVVILLFVVWAFYLEGINFLYDPYKQPAVKGVKELRGNYDVAEFRINNKVIPYAPLDSIRWSEVTFEKWTSLSFKVNKPVQIDLSNGGGSPAMDIHRTTEVAGLAGGRRVFYYQADTVKQILYLQDKNIAGIKAGDLNERRVPDKILKDSIYPADWIPKESLAAIGNELYKINPKAMSTTRIREYEAGDKFKNRNKMILHYQIIDGGTQVILSGTNEKRDSVYIVLNRINRRYTLTPSKLDAGVY